MSQPLAGFETTTDQVLDGIDLAGRTALVTGASSGLGAETARALASRGARVWMAARQVEKTQGVADSIAESTGNDRLTVLNLDLNSFSAIRRAAARVASEVDGLDLLINNAGVMACPLERNAEGLEMQFGTNHIGHFLFTGLLAPQLVAGRPARVVNLSSGGHKFSPVLWDDWNFEKGDYDKFTAYGQAKTANALFTVGLDRRLAGQGVRSFAVHPGVILTELGRHMTEEDIKTLMGGDRIPGGRTGGLKFKTVEQGAATQVWAATSPDLEGKGALYLEDCHIAEVSDGGADGYLPYALDSADAERLWTLSEEIVGQNFEF